jgi:hypothetical protein
MKSKQRLVIFLPWRAPLADSRQSIAFGGKADVGRASRVGDLKLVQLPVLNQGAITSRLATCSRR